MTRPTIRIHDLETDEIIDREMNDAEFAALEQMMATRPAYDTLPSNSSTPQAGA